MEEMESGVGGCVSELSGVLLVVSGGVTARSAKMVVWH